MKKLLVALFVLFALSLARLSYAANSGAPSGSINSFEIGQATGTAPVLVTSGTGSLADIIISTGAAADFVQCFDSASATGYTATAVALAGTSTAPKIGQLSVAATNTTTGFPAGTPSQYFANGLVCLKSAAGDNAQVLWK